MSSIVKTLVLWILLVPAVLFASTNNVIIYTAPEQLPETSQEGVGGICLNAFPSTFTHTYDSVTQTGTLTFPNDLTYIGDYAFFLCTQMTSITFPTTVTSIGAFAFNGCEMLDSLVLPDSLLTIGESAFSFCFSLSALVLPSKLLSIEQFAFEECTSISSLTCKALLPPTCGVAAIEAIADDVPVYVPIRSLDLYKADPDWSRFLSILIMPEYESHDVFFFVAQEKEAMVRMSTFGSPDPIRLEYSLDRYHWDNYKIGYTIQLDSVGDTLFFRAGGPAGHNPTFSKGFYHFYQFVLVGNVSSGGNVMSLLDASCQQDSLPPYAFIQLFLDCRTLTSAPVLPATKMAPGCYQGMFNSCSELTEAPELPSMQLAHSCYKQMFAMCWKLAKHPSLPATTLAPCCYMYMFDACFAMTTMPALPATTLADSCYLEMASTIPALRIDTFGDGAEWMIPAEADTTGLVRWNQAMFAATGGDFKGAPLPGVMYYVGSTPERFETATLCWGDSVMWHGQKAMLTGSYHDTIRYDDGIDSCHYTLKVTTHSPVASYMDTVSILSGDLYSWHGLELYDAGVYYDTAYYLSGCDSIYYGLTLRLIPNTREFLYFVAQTTDARVTLTPYGHPDTVFLQYSTDRLHWFDYQIDTEVFMQEINDTVFFRAGGPDRKNISFSKNDTDYYSFLLLEPVIAGGNIMSLLDASCLQDTVPDYAFCNLFAQNPLLLEAPSLPAAHLNPYCYSAMFAGCIGLEQLPLLPATDLAQGCYLNMFTQCSHIILNTSSPGTPWSIPASADTLEAANWNLNMFDATGGDFTSSPVPGHTYYIAKCLQLAADLPAYDSVVVELVPMYNRWNIVINLNKLKRDLNLPLTADNLEASWYKVVDEPDELGFNGYPLGDDVLLKQGFYYTNASTLTGEYYVLIRIRKQDDECDLVLLSPLLYLADAARSHTFSVERGQGYNVLGQSVNTSAGLIIYSNGDKVLDPR